ncbi:MAG TPA: MYXO-CTERM sorting domain-containing protein [Polyangiaceae bacterium]|jgi:MYXO-CTERM domain-containing protein
MLVVLLVLVLPTSALAQPAPTSNNDVDVVQAELDRDYVQALSSDCALACRALESMKRATERLCALDPGDRCASAKKKLDDATIHVRSACPACAEALEELKPTATPVPQEAPAGENVVEAESVPKKGGCAGCATTSTPADALVPLGLAGLLLLVSRRRRR